MANNVVSLTGAPVPPAGELPEQYQDLIEQLEHLLSEVKKGHVKELAYVANGTSDTSNFYSFVPDGGSIIWLVGAVSILNDGIKARVESPW